MKEIINSFLHLVMRSYVIVMYSEGVKYYYRGFGSKWTTEKAEAKKYKNKPDFYWMSELWHSVEKYYA